MSDSTDLFLQVRTAHRLLASYYQRVHQLISEVIENDDLNLAPLMWNSAKFTIPGNRSTNMLERWAWDMLPGVASNFFFYHGDEKGKQALGDWMLAIQHISDTGVFDENIDGTEEPDGKDIEKSVTESETVLRFYIHAPHQKMAYHWIDTIWNDTDYAQVDSEQPVQCLDINDRDKIYVSAFEMKVSELMGQGSAKKLIERIIEHRNAVLPPKNCSL
ncbi:hypothetical protein DXX93_07215 [Thalassotalea euphylliae]|uniref:Uncharacterized protein n=1 Tax=Thalassotalea euphylliae TaxID=1655234 RepID=A0A3E0TPF7_9GAMM|nr:hypothetical protein [Thalassotalea euphylliae]REL26388.1 hypothetical protein DXX93_07215 [Thalassotalea euphylliae]